MEGNRTAPESGDVPAESSVEKALARRYAQLDALQDAVITTDLRSVVFEANRAAALMLNVPLPFLVGRPLLHFVARRDCERMRAALADLQRTGEIPWLDISLRPRHGQAPFLAEARARAERSSGHGELRVHWSIRDRRTKPAPMPAPIREASRPEQSATGVLLADDHRIVLSGLRALLEHEKDMIVLGEAEDGAVAIKMVAELNPSVVVMDVALPGIDGIEATQQIRAQHPAVQIVALSAFSDAATAARMLAAGAIGYLPKDAAFDELANAIRAAAKQQGHVSEKIEARLAAARHV